MPAGTDNTHYHDYSGGMPDQRVQHPARRAVPVRALEGCNE